MELLTDYPLSLPSDAVASVGTSEFLGSLYVEIDATHASGPPVENGGQISSQESIPITAAGLERMVRNTAEMLKDQSDEQKSAGKLSRKPRSGQASVPKPHSN